MSTSRPYCRSLLAWLAAMLSLVVMIGSAAQPAMSITARSASTYAYDAGSNTSESTFATDVAGTITRASSNTSSAAYTDDLSTLLPVFFAPDSATVGASRVDQVVASYGDDVVDTGRAVKTPYGSTDIDVVLKDNTFIEVGGPAKSVNLAKFGQQLQRLQWAADQAGGRAVFMYARDTPQSAIDLANKWFGPGGAQPIP